MNEPLSHPRASSNHYHKITLLGYCGTAKECLVLAKIQSGLIAVTSLVPASLGLVWAQIGRFV
jgi:hypothetical protein